MATFKTQAIILHKRFLREADRLYILYSKDFGKIEAQVRSAAKTTSKLAGGLEPISLADLMIVKGKSMETIAGVQLYRRYNFSLADTALVNIVRELFLRSVKPFLSEPVLYQNLVSYLELMSQDQPLIYKRFLTQRFIWQMLNILGHVSADVIYQKNLPANLKDALLACLSRGNLTLQIKHNLLQEVEKFTGNYLRESLESDLHSLKYIYD